MNTQLKVSKFDKQVILIQLICVGRQMHKLFENEAWYVAPIGRKHI